MRKDDELLAELRRRLIYNRRTGLFTRRIDNRRHKAGTVLGSLHSEGYVNIRFDGVLYFAHRLAWFYVMGVWPNMIDHRNRVRNDNRWSNLREATREQNQHNRDVCGVHQHSQTKRWVAQIGSRGKTIHLGCFSTREESLAARKEAEKQRDQLCAR